MFEYFRPAFLPEAGKASSITIQKRNVAHIECTCKFYKIDMEAKEEAERMETLFPAAFPEEEPAGYSEHMETSHEENDPFASCGIFCRYLRSGNGYPGEHVYYCCAAGNEHVIHVDFNESEII